MSSDSREKILTAARLKAQARGYNGLNFRDLAEDGRHSSGKHLPPLSKQGSA